MSKATQRRSDESAALHRVSEELARLSQKVASLEQQVVLQSQRFDDISRENVQLMMTNMVEVIRAFNKTT